MDRKEFIEKIDSKIKLIRNERDFSQDRMAEIIGISKKTLVQIEKRRATLGWSGAVVVCSLFKDSEVLQMILGEDLNDIVISLAFGRCEGNYMKTMGGKLWWNDIKKEGEYRLQQNIVSGHFRILDNDDRRICSSFDEEYINKRMEELVEE
ncbi:helix-turn-helix transcriptional regulator [Clostridium botulinum]|uniref:XRE family transcriptional regulator n=1 Tax=Clostridium botulinum TaxID=1491 RepID=A0A9Q1ZC25_CLOBO|nr:helix-turn-helix domain-containing protein [Clostridium botulinum]AEB74990.1 helix-turn-helix domain protein [Clostridium botulinum BKT015925]KEI01779.1 XRE family transcriptional regulator [Clostridium botulinum C/D str. Sp77]KEI03625.1 XRE family transcriptional regulator [Clostridium botulinum D str. 16868]KLU76986.1 XRE family transcriptional regulator [Clostridium botulinum V891]KOA73980.1 XRE family transcriptional regulator [Clostridium botulinum]